MVFWSGFFSFLILVPLSAGVIVVASPAANGATGCVGYVDPVNRAQSFWTRARLEQVRACAAQLGTGPGADPRRPTPLHLAAVFSVDSAFLDVLLKAGADPNGKMDDGWTPLHYAAEYHRDPAFLDALLKAGADPNAKGNKGVTPVHVAAQSNENPAILATLLEGGGDPNAKDREGHTPIRLAAQHNSNPAVVAALLEGGADPNVKENPEGTTPMHLAAAFSDNPAVVTVLLKAGADPSARKRNGVTPLHLAAQQNSNLGVVAALLKAGGNPNAKAANGATPLHQAALNNSNQAVVAALLKAGGNPNAKAANGATPLHLAAEKNSNPAVVAALLKGGADAAATFRGRTAFDLARNNAHVKGSSVYQQLRTGRKQTVAADAETGLERADYRAIQRQLNKKGFKVGPEDGRWGPTSLSALQAFQAQAGLPRTGVPDKATRAALGVAAGAKAETPREKSGVAEEVSWRGDCIVGMQLRPGEGCRLSDGTRFIVLANGCARMPDTPILSWVGCIEGSAGMNKFKATKNKQDSVWRIEASP